VLKREEITLQGRERGEVVRREDLALDDREVDLDLVQPTRVDGCVHGRERRPTGLQAGIALRPTVRGAVVHDPEEAARRLVGLLAHHEVDETIEGDDPGTGGAEPEESGAMHVPRGEVRPRSAPFVLMLDPLGVAGSHGRRWMTPGARLNAGLFVRREDVVVGPQRPA
jgi:hypothetical protein